ncbi:hypothetical protein [Aeromonas simiae]|uniref:RiboL-PSP-HEPN domain-containing protein n=1 Tax=Aeromonas simiae TaxID=218936 RepID=A0A5J6X1Y7_9GAMM|nr:hypothetical protein [Aeromonas simiae]QFI56467.1 hypothetical protein FE240_18355 [Aeromonas simiae]
MSEDIHNMELRAKLTGYICTQYSYFDYLVSNVIWHILKIDKPVGMIVTGAMDIRPKIEMAISLLEHHDIENEIRSTLQKFKNNASKENGFISKRNKIVHGIFSSREGDSAVMVEAHRKKSHRERHEMDVEYIQQCYGEIVAANNELVPLLESRGINVH